MKHKTRIEERTIDITQNHGNYVGGIRRDEGVQWMEGEEI